jgi:hypothetical protein
MTIASGIRSGPRTTLRAGVNPSDTVTPSLLGFGTAVYGSGAATPGVVAGTASGDIEILYAWTSQLEAAISLSAEAGFTSIDEALTNYGAGTIYTQTHLWWRRIVGGETAPTVADNNGNVFAQIFAIRSCTASGDPWDFVTTTDNNTADLALVLAGGDTLGSNRLVVALAAAFYGAAITIGSYANSTLTSVAEVLDEDYQNGSDWVHTSMMTGVRAAAGTVGNTTATYVAAYSIWNGFVIAFKP